MAYDTSDENQKRCIDKPEFGLLAQIVDTRPHVGLTATLVRKHSYVDDDDRQIYTSFTFDVHEAGSSQQDKNGRGMGFKGNPTGSITISLSGDNFEKLFEMGKRYEFTSIVPAIDQTPVELRLSEY